MEKTNPEHPNLTVFSIGHSNHSVGKLVELLKKFRISTIVDVRSSPYSQYSPQFNRETLEFTLKSEGLKYKFAGDYLGGRPKDPSCYFDGNLPEGKADYLHLVNYPKVMTKDFFLKGIARLLDLAQSEQVAVMCSEENPALCHRHHLIGRYLIQEGITVIHIRADGNSVNDQQLPNLVEKPSADQLRLF